MEIFLFGSLWFWLLTSIFSALIMLCIETALVKEVSEIALQEYQEQDTF